MVPRFAIAASLIAALVALTAAARPAPIVVTTATTSATATPPSVACSGSNAVETAYVARDPGYIVVNGGLNLLDHLWTSNLNASNTTFLGGLTNWYQTGLIVSYTGTTDPNGCILDSLTVAPAVTIATTSLPAATTGIAYQAPVSAAWGVAPYALTVAGLPAGLSFDGSSIGGTPTSAGTFTLTITATDAVGAAATAQVALLVNQGGSYTVKDESKGKITAIDPNYTYVMVNAKKLLVTPSTFVIVNTPDGERHVLDSFVQVGMKVQWKGLRDKATNTVLTSQIEIN
ncbi:MAG: Ig domain-containing protein [Anaerolineae bacterium]